MSYTNSVLIGGIGDDAHSVGIRLLELGLREAGLYVHNIGIRNDIKRFFELAKDFDVIMISNKNGHAELYLKEFPQLLSKFKLENDESKVWCLGGSLSVGESDFQVKKRYLHMGFDIVHPKPVSFETVLEQIRTEIGKAGIPERHVHDFRPLANAKIKDIDQVINRKWSEEELQRDRFKVLMEWPTGKEVGQMMPEPGSRKKPDLDSMLWHNKLYGRYPLLQPRTGVASIKQQSTLLTFLEQNGSHVSSVQLDAASRSRMYDKAELGVKVSEERKTSQLNGFPIPVYGVKQVRKMVESMKTPFQLRGGGPDHRFTYEIALSAGITALEGGFLCYCLPYDKETSPVESLRNWQYIDRLCAHYTEKTGVLINREYFGVLTATLIEPSIAIVINVIQSLVSAQQGIQSLSVGYAEQGNRSQDIAAIQVLEEMTKHYLHKWGYNCRVTTVYHQFMAAFPADYEKASDLIRNSSTTAALSGATKMMVKTPVEAINIPSRYDNAKALEICRQGYREAKHAVVNHFAIEEEKKLITHQVKLIMEAIIEEGNGNIIKGALKGLENGLIDIPWSPSIYNANKVITVRDVDGAVRFYDFGNLPFDQKTKEFHQNKVTIRKTLERDPSIFSLLEKDLSRIWKNDYKQWPLDGTYVD